jgi:hypothetical protein
VSQDLSGVFDTQVAIAFDRPALVYDVQQSLLATPPTVTPLDEVDKASNGYYWLSSSVRGQGVVISEPLRSTYAAVAYPVPPRINLEKLDHEGWVSIPDMINQALNFIMYYEGGIYMYVAHPPHFHLRVLLHDENELNIRIAKNKILHV